MSDYLSRLSERALGVASLVQPTIAPLFAATPIAMVFPTSEVEENDRSRRRTTNVFPPEMASSVAAPTNERTVMEPSPEELNDETPREKRLFFPNSSMEADTGDKALYPKLSFQSENPHITQTILATNVESGHTNGIREHTPETRPVPPEFPAIALSPRPAAATVVPMADRGLPTNEPMTRSDESVELDPAGRISVKLTGRRVIPDSGRHELGADEAPEFDTQRLMAQLKNLGDTAAPTMESEPNITSSIVRINIGRIEVRAVQHPVALSPQPRREPVRPSVTLTDYLMKKRGAGT